MPTTIYTYEEAILSPVEYMGIVGNDISDLQAIVADIIGGAV